MYNRESILREENEFPRLFASCSERDYGLLFYNEANKESYDSNHAILYPEKVPDLGVILPEIVTFYREKGIVPSIYHPFQAGYFQDHRAELEDNGFTIGKEENRRIMILTQANGIHPHRRLDIRRIEQWDERVARDILLPLGMAYEVPPTRDSMLHPDNHLFVGYLGETAISMVTLHVSRYGCTRFDFIITAKDHRGKGYAREVLGTAVDFCTDHQFPPCFQWPAHPTSEHMTNQAGFRFAFEIEAGYAAYKESI